MTQETMSEGEKKRQAMRDVRFDRVSAPHWRLSNAHQTTFYGLRLSRSPSWVPIPGRVFTGKAESEWGFPQSWGALVEAGLITYELIDRPTARNDGSTMTHAHWSFTDLGRSVSADLDAYDVEAAATYRSAQQIQSEVGSAES